MVWTGAGVVWTGAGVVWTGAGVVWTGAGLVWTGAGLVWTGAGLVWTGAGLVWTGAGLVWTGAGLVWTGAGLVWTGDECAGDAACPGDVVPASGAVTGGVAGLSVDGGNTRARNGAGTDGRLPAGFAVWPDPVDPGVGVRATATGAAAVWLET